MSREAKNERTATGGLLTVRQVAELLGVCERTIFSLTQEGKLPAARIDRAVRYDPCDVAGFIEASKSGRVRAAKAGQPASRPHGEGEP